MIVASLLLILVAVMLLLLGLSGGSSALLIGSIVASLLAAVALVIGARQTASARRAAGEPGGETPADFPPPRETFTAESAEMARSAPPADSDLRETVQLEPVPPVGASGAYDEPAPEPSWQQAPQPSWQHAEAAHLSDAGAAAEAGAEAAAPAGTAPAPEPRPAGSGFVGSGSARGGSGGAEFAEADEEDPADEPLPQAVSPADAVRVARMDAEVLVVDGRPRYHVPECPHLAGRLTEGIGVNEAVELGFTPCGRCRPVDRLVAAATHR